MGPDGSPLDAVETASRVANVIDDLDNCTEEESLALLSDFLCAAWGSVLAQNQ